MQYLQKDVSKKVYCVVLMLIVLSCSTVNERLIKGKWSLAGRMVGGTPSSFWFKGSSTVVAPWEKHQYAFHSSGTYTFVSDMRIKIIMKKGYYKGKTYFFNVAKLDENLLIMSNDYEDIKMRRVQ